jgi:hypothetical protein
MIREGKSIVFDEDEKKLIVSLHLEGRLTPLNIVKRLERVLSIQVSPSTVERYLKYTAKCYDSNVRRETLGRSKNHLGKSLSEESRNKIGKAITASWQNPDSGFLSPNYKEKLSEAKRLQISEGRFNYGKSKEEFLVKEILNGAGFIHNFLLRDSKGRIIRQFDFFSIKVLT